jgi:hypothetical protein
MYLYIPDVFGRFRTTADGVYEQRSVALGAGEENPKTFMVVRASLSVIVVADYVCVVSDGWWRTHIRDIINQINL